MPKSRYQPTEEKRKKVKALAGLGVPQEQICTMIGLRSQKTLRRYFSKELLLGIAESSANVHQSAFKQASSAKNPAMTIFWLKTRLGWSPNMAVTPENDGVEQLIYIYEDYKVPTASEPP
jgi:hypothetical protein